MAEGFNDDAEGAFFQPLSPPNELEPCPGPKDLQVVSLSSMEVDTELESPASKCSHALRARSSMPIVEFFRQNAQELRLNAETAQQCASRLAQELLFSTEDLYLLSDKESFMQLPLPMYVRRWLAEERHGRLCNPESLREAAEAAGDSSPPKRGRSSFSNMAESVPVEVTVQINSVTAINIKRILFDVDFTLMLDWQDPSVMGMTAKEIDQMTMTIFNPEVVIDNAVDNDQPISGGCNAPRPNRLVDGVCPDGQLKKTNRYRLSLTCNGLDLRAFPFDTQILPIRLKARNKSTLHGEEGPEAILVGPEGLYGDNKKHGLRRTGHTVKMLADRLADFKIQSLMGLRSELPDRWYEVRIIVERSPGHALRNVATPCLVILIFSFTIYAIPMSELGSRLENTATCLLAMMAFQGVVNEMLPPVSYETALGRYVTAVYIILMFHGVEHALFSTLTSKSDSVAPRDRPIDIFFGAVEFWDAQSDYLNKVEAVLVIAELVLILFIHVAYVLYLFWLRRRGKAKRLREAERPGVSLVDARGGFGTRNSARSSARVRTGTTSAATRSRSIGSGHTTPSGGAPTLLHSSRPKKGSG
ncbi:Acetylcholine receptor subunit gamma [Durusdinium trenchii]|uniref:Acetylcholine receptor subunit gamma n=1 Tax=Durusdinium trenchii TaxID=1381693 RepID=A0ABP0IAQ5_9DINO